jgi:DNA polymerase III gamma/tau subunit
MCESYDIQTAGHIDTLKLICKTSLKANQLIDLGDVEGAQKMIKVYDTLMKSGKFTAAQNKAENGEFVDSVSELVVLCEQEGFIPRFYIEQPNDKVDATLQDLKNYTHQLVTDEMNLGNLIENAVKEMTRQEEKEEDEDIDEVEDLTLDDLDAIKDKVIEDGDFEDYNEFLDDEQEDDNAAILNVINSSKEEVL